MSDYFVKLYGDRLLGSSLMDEDLPTRWLFVCLLGRADANGYVRCQTVGNAARFANITTEQARRGLRVLSSPDKNSTTPDEQGRRIVPAEGGWRIVNHAKYRELRTTSQVNNARRQREFRARQGAVTRNGRNGDVAEVSTSTFGDVEEGSRGGAPAPPVDLAACRLWAALKTRLSASIAPHTFATWFRPLERAHYGAGVASRLDEPLVAGLGLAPNPAERVLEVEVPNGHFRRWCSGVLAEKCRLPLAHDARALGIGDLGLRFVVSPTWAGEPEGGDR